MHRQPRQSCKLAHHPLRKLAVAGNTEATKSAALLTDTNNPFFLQFLRDQNIPLRAFEEFDRSVSSQIITALSPGYDAARRETDNAFNHYPLMVITCNSTSDVVNTIKFCRATKLRVCMRAGGHSTAGYSVINNTVLVDVSGLQGVHVDPHRMVATVGAGVRWGQLNNELDAWGLHTVTGSCSDVGCLGYTLGGGYGYTSPKFGMGCDNLIGISMVTYDGRIVTASETENPELLWAHRGGTGGNFGVVIGLTYQLHKLRTVYPISLNWSIADAAKLMVTWQNEMTKTLHDRSLGLLGFLCFGNRQRFLDAKGAPCYKFEPYFCVRGIYVGDDPAAGAKALEPLMRIGKPQVPPGCPAPFTSTTTYAAANEHLLDNTEGVIPDTIKETKRCAFVSRQLSEADYQKIVDHFCKSPCEYNILSIEPCAGRINDISASATAYVHRDSYCDIFTDSFWNTDDEKAAAFAWLKDMYESPQLKPLWSGHYYQNYPNSDYPNWEQGYFGSNYSRLQQIKKQWDPENFFAFPQSIRLPSS